jgi:hypothetical protein
MIDQRRLAYPAVGREGENAGSRGADLFGRGPGSVEELKLLVAAEQRGPGFGEPREIDALGGEEGPFRRVLRFEIGHRRAQPARSR